jgi:hypothetical protein
LTIVLLRNHRHNSYVLVFFYLSGTHEIDFDVFSIQPGSMFFTARTNASLELSDDVEGFVIFYAGNV